MAISCFSTSRCSLRRARERARGTPTPCTPSQPCAQRTQGPRPALGLGGGYNPRSRSQPQFPPVCEQGGSHGPGQDFRGSGQGTCGSPVHFSTDRQGVQALGTAGGGTVGPGSWRLRAERWDMHTAGQRAPVWVLPRSGPASVPDCSLPVGTCTSVGYGRVRTDQVGAGLLQDGQAWKGTFLSPRRGLSPSQPRIC